MEFKPTTEEIRESKRGKPILFIIDAPDRCGKDTILNLMSPTKQTHIFKQQNVDIPHYRHDREAFGVWLEEYLRDQNKKLIKLANQGKNVIMARLFNSEFVYAQIFDRTTIIDEIYVELQAFFNIKQLVMVYKSYSEYLRRCDEDQSEVEYDYDEFTRLQYLYTNSPYNQKIDTVIQIGAYSNPVVLKELIMSTITCGEVHA
jgi:hypothetical protein